MRSVFEKIRAAGGKMTIVENDTAGKTDKTDVVFRQLDGQNRLSGKSGIRLPHGTEVQLAKNARYLVSGTWAEKHIYIKVSYNGKEGYIAAEHLNTQGEKPVPEKKIEPVPTPIPLPERHSVPNPVIKTIPAPVTDPVPDWKIRREGIQVRDDKTTYGDFAKKWKTTVAELNIANSPVRNENDIIKKDTIIYLPTKKKKKKNVSSAKGVDSALKNLE